MPTATSDTVPRSLVDPIRHAVGALAAVCDGAHERDGQGFDGQDTKFGHRLVALPVDDWTPEMARAAWEMLHKYRGQLDGFGIDVDALPEPSDHPDFKKRWARQDARIKLKETERAAARIIDVDAAGDTFVVAFPYDKELVGLMRSVPGRRYDGSTKTNLVPAESAGHLTRFVDDHGFRLTDAAAELHRAWRDHEPPLPSVTVRLHAGALHLAFPYDPELNAAAKTLPGVSFSRKPEPGWAVPVTYVDEVAAWLEGKPHSITDDAAAVFERAEADRAMRLASAAEDAELPDWLTERLGLELYPFQRAGVDYAMKARTTIIGDEMGLGKTLQALATLEACDAYPAVIVVPTSLTINWQRETAKLLPHRTTQIVEGNAQQLTWADIIILGWSVLHSHVPILSGCRGAVFDEFHFAKHIDSRRSRAAQELSAAMPDDAVILGATGTAVDNAKATELIPQLKILRRLDEFGGAAEFKRRYARGNWNELNRRLRERCYVRRLKKDVLKDLPPKRWLPVLVDVDPEVMAEYHRAEADIVAYVADRARAIAAELGEDPDSAAVEAALRAESAKHLIAIGQLKQLAAKAKMPGIREWAGQFIDAGQKLIMFGWHRPTVDGLADAFKGAVRVHGDITGDDRQAAVDAFQTDPSVPIISCSIRAAGVGLTLTAASDVGFAEFGWTPGEMDQGADRAHRIGQRESVTAWMLVAPGTIDEWIVELIETKRTVVNAILNGDMDGDPEEAASASVAGDLLVRLRDRGLAAQR